jgi:hypothetical protein
MQAEDLVKQLPTVDKTLKIQLKKNQEKRKQEEAQQAQAQSQVKLGDKALPTGSSRQRRETSRQLRDRLHLRNPYSRTTKKRRRRSLSL